MRHLANGLRHLIVPEMAVAAEVDGRVVGATFGLPDYNPRIKEINGRLVPLRLHPSAAEPPGHQEHPHDQHERAARISALGIGLVLMNGLVPRVDGQWGHPRGRVLPGSSNRIRLSYGALEKGGAKITKTYRLYDWDEPLAADRGDDGSRVTNAESEAASRSDDDPSRHSPRRSPPRLEIRDVHGRGDLDGSSTCRGGSTPRTRTGCRRC